MKVIIVGGVAGGATTAARLRRLDEKAEIVIFERGNHISFANCGLPYYIGNVIKNREDLLVQTPQKFKERFNIDVRIKQEVLSIDRENKKVTIKNHNTKETYEESYDKLVLSPGAEPINPFKNIELPTLRTIEDAVSIKKHIEKEKPKNVAIIGGGYIGLEMAENLVQNTNANITIIQKSSHVIPPLDEDMASMVHSVLRKNKINLLLEKEVKFVDKNENNITITFDNKEEIKADYAILVVGVMPETKLAIDCKLEVNSKGSIIVNKYMQTNDKYIYALGDAVQVTNFVTKMPAYIPLAGPANRQARIVANHICNRKGTYEGTVGSSILKIFNYQLGITGINESTCIAHDINYKTMIISPYSHVTYYPGAKQLTIKAIYSQDNGRILGAQVWGKASVDKITDILATVIRMNGNAQDLEELELCYAPPFSAAKSPVNILGNAIENERQNLVDSITWKQVLELSSPYILDVRTDEEYENSHIEKAKHIPLEKLRDRIDEISKEQTIYVYCHTGLRSYIACRILMQNGFKVKNIIGGYYFYTVTKM